MSEDLSKRYGSQFYEAYGDRSRQAAAVVVPIVNELVRPTSVLDVGCGVGAWLAEWMREGVSDVIGLDGEHVDGTVRQIEASRFHALDLTNSFTMGRTFDLVECLEVAEHLDESYASRLIQSLTRHADTILFSAAIPGQRGFHHVNEQWPSYWIAKFADFGFKPFDVIRPIIWEDTRVDIWYRQNILLFSKVHEFTMQDKYVDVVHPALWAQRQDPSCFTLRQLLMSLPTVLMSTVRWYSEQVRLRFRSH
jgi:SAM-dependent methyltransferase